MMKLGLVFAIAAALIGDFSGKYLAEYQPEKLAAAEWHFETEEGAPLVLLGILDGKEIKYAFKVPYALSILAHDNPFSEVTGLNDFPEDEVPPLYIHYMFDGMVMIGMFLLFLSIVYVFGKVKKWKFISARWFRWIVVMGGPLAVLAIELGWWLAEVGRQPWILRGFMRTAEGATTSNHVDIMLVLFAGLYLVLGIGSIVVLRRMFKNNPVEQELEDRHAEKGGDFS
jgi:cytochrome d ubiquinol oxidase subunit I